MAKGGERYPVISMGNFGWDGDQWIKIVASVSGLAVNVRSWGFPEIVLTGRDITLDIQSLADPAIIGVLRSMGDAGAGPTNVVGRTFMQWFNDILEAIGEPGGVPTDAILDETVRRFLERIAASSDTIGAVAGLLRTLGDPGLAPVAPATGKTVAKILEDILVALGGVGSPQWDSYFTRNTGAAPFAVTVDSTVDGGRIVVSCHASMPLVAGNNATIVIETSNDNANWCPEFTWTITNGGTVSQQFFNARRYIRQNATAVAGGILTMDLASSR